VADRASLTVEFCHERVAPGRRIILACRRPAPAYWIAARCHVRDDLRIARAIEQGAAATLDKTTYLPEIIDAVRRLRTGEERRLARAR
jgi:hypothetical protein